MTMTAHNKKRWQAVQQRDPTADGQFVFAVCSTGIYCRPSCPARRPAPRQAVFFPTCDAAEQSGFRPCRRCHPREPSAHAAIVARACRFIEANREEQINLAALAAEVRMSSFHLQKIFKRSLGVSPREYADACRFQAFRYRLKGERSVTDAVYAAGYGSSSRAYARATSRLGMTPARYRRGAAQTQISYSTAKCALGHLDGEKRRLDLPLDVRATAFQWRVWTALRAFACGETRSYTQVAKSVGQPKAVRAVARACAANPAALLIPCHRVVRNDGRLGGYRWGSGRKRILLANERCQLQKHAR
jgi:AraC family transcriptional regulator of adaptative response/methylated-DNA-[protein]-cysteine methyltransferase